VLEQLDAVRQRACELPRHGEADGIVAAQRVADADHLQTRSTSSRRKCVAHEMHGS